MADGRTEWWPVFVLDERRFSRSRKGALRRAKTARARQQERNRRKSDGRDRDVTGGGDYGIRGGKAARRGLPFGELGTKKSFRSRACPSNVVTRARRSPLCESASFTFSSARASNSAKEEKIAELVCRSI